MMHWGENENESKETKMERKEKKKEEIGGKEKGGQKTKNKRTFKKYHSRYKTKKIWGGGALSPCSPQNIFSGTFLP